MRNLKREAASLPAVMLPQASLFSRISPAGWRLPSGGWDQPFPAAVSQDCTEGVEDIKRDLAGMLLGLLLLFLCAGCGVPAAPSEEAGDGTAQRSFFAMNTYIAMRAEGPAAGEALLEAENLICRLEGQFSVTGEGSEIYAANHSGGAPVPVSADTEELLALALDMARETGGALDPTIYPVLSAWGFTTETRQVPSPEELDALLPLVDHEQISLRDHTVAVPDGMALDLGAVAKGYTGDRAAELLEASGISSALINLGGNVQAVGKKPDGSAWRVGVRSPFSEGNIGVLEVEDCAVVTSGGYQNYFVGEDGQVYWHILDPETGYPARTGLASVTVVAERGAYCDALSTALFVMELDDALDYWRAHRDFEALLVTEDGMVCLTPGLSGRFTLNEDAVAGEAEVVEP